MLKNQNKIPKINKISNENEILKNTSMLSQKQNDIM